MTAASTSERVGKHRLTEVEPSLFTQHNGPLYRIPIDLQVTPDARAQFPVVGACLAEVFAQLAPMINPAVKGEFMLLNNFDPFPDPAAIAQAQYDFQIIQIPLRTILGNAFFQLPDDGSRHEEFLQQTQEHVARYLSNALKLNTERKLLTFVLGFLVPQQNPLGRFQPRIRSALRSNSSPAAPPQRPADCCA
jgi:hypothetical protein